MEYIKRDLEDKIKALTEDYSCILITGPRQVGKTTVLRKLMTEDREYEEINEYDLQVFLHVSSTLRAMGER